MEEVPTSRMTSGRLINQRNLMPNTFLKLERRLIFSRYVIVAHPTLLPLPFRCYLQAASSTLAL